VKGHSNIKGKKRVDGEAKKAAKGKTSKAHNLPEFLTENLLPLTVSGVQTEVKGKREGRMGRITPVPQTLTQ
jgi:hypothetical protein